MKLRRSWEQVHIGPRPPCFDGEPEPDIRPSSFSFTNFDFGSPPDRGTARLYYRVGWTAIVFWNSKTYFADEILTFDGMIELIRERFRNAIAGEPGLCGLTRLPLTFVRNAGKILNQAPVSYER